MLSGYTEISIHALREEGDCCLTALPSWPAYFYPRPPRGGRHTIRPHRHDGGAISIHALREEGDLCEPRGDVVAVISIHALREEGDRQPWRGRACCGNFYPRPPRGGRPPVDDAGELQDDISIHALREEGDALSRFWTTRSRYFYPRPPRGGRQQKQRQNLYFQTNYTTFCTNLEEP